ncbi:NYN domain-containing protein, partial [Candidatus Micrarchaeota archaeon]|nr:NYN domain-containing protein [Candidatus Micrarchaeota archaeon]
MGVLIRKPLAALFIDASNFYHSLKKQNDLPFDAEQFASLAKELSNAFELKEIYFYDSEKDISRDPLGYSKQQRFHERLRKELKNLEIRTRKLRYVTSISKEDAAKEARSVGLPQNTDDK